MASSLAVLDFANFHKKSWIYNSLRTIEYLCATGYKEISSFRKVLEDVELQMGQIRTALERQLRSSALSVDEAVSSSATLLDLGEDRARVSTE